MRKEKKKDNCQDMIFSKDGDSEYIEPDDEDDMYDDEEDEEKTVHKAMN
jgi:hypothetical protein